MIKLIDHWGPSALHGRLHGFSLVCFAFVWCAFCFFGAVVGLNSLNFKFKVLVH